MNFDQREVDEYVSSDEEDKAQDRNKIIEENKNEDAAAAKSKKNDMIFKPFKPGKCHAGMRQFPQSICDMKV